ncbi:hypothetical protein [Elizabethkingia anophelis]|uniref:hypothetical protein n=1 Tax=Elizabethkingia anophelis TaxID=1117645 RepID=UPI0038923D52
MKKILSILTALLSVYVIISCSSSDRDDPYKEKYNIYGIWTITMYKDTSGKWVDTSGNMFFGNDDQTKGVFIEKINNISSSGKYTYDQKDTIRATTNTYNYIIIINYMNNDNAEFEVTRDGVKITYKLLRNKS